MDSTKVTNSSFRKAFVTSGRKAKIPDRMIAEMVGHRGVGSLKNYDYVDMGARRAMAMAAFLGSEATDDKHTTSKTSAEKPPPPEQPKSKATADETTTTSSTDLIPILKTTTDALQYMAVAMQLVAKASNTSDVPLPVPPPPPPLPVQLLPAADVPLPMPSLLAEEFPEVTPEPTQLDDELKEGK